MKTARKLAVHFLILQSCALTPALFSFAAQAEDEAPVEVAPVPELSLSDILELRLTTLATGTAKPLNLAPSVASVITAADIEAMGARTFEDVIDTVPGVHVTMGPVGAARYIIRGVATVYNPETLVMINGVPITSVTKAERNGRMGALPVSMISRVEVIRGPGSALYGAEAFAGVINVITKNADDIKGTKAGVRSGSYNTQETWVQTSHIDGDYKMALMANYMTTNGQKREIDVDTLRTSPLAMTPGPMSLGIESTDVMLDLEKGKWRLQAAQRNIDNVGMGQGLGDNLDPKTRGNRQRTTVDLTYQDLKVAQDWEMSTKLGYLHGTQEFANGIMIFPPGMNLGNGAFADGVRGKPEYKERNWHLDATTAYKGLESHTFRLGVGGFIAHLYEVKESKNFSSNFTPLGNMVDVTDTTDVWLPEKKRENYHAFAQDEWQFADKWELTAGARFDHFSDFGDTINPRGALVWQTTPELTSKLMYGRAFRSPSFVELYGQNNPVAKGNPELKPETNQVFELAFAYQASRTLNTSLNIFHYQVRNNITFVKDGAASTATAQNAGDSNGDGFELEAQYKISSRVSLTGNYAYAKTKELSTGRDVGDYPIQQAYLREEWSFLPQWSLNTQARWIGARPRTPVDVRDKMPEYITVDVLTRAQKLVGDWNFSFSVRNVFDTDVREPSSPPSVTSGKVAIPNDLPLEGRNYFAEVSCDF